MAGASKRGGPVDQRHGQAAEVVVLNNIFNEFKSLHREHMLILDAIKNISNTVTPELEAAVKKVAAKAIAIDQQVPDITVPPHP